MNSGMTGIQYTMTTGLMEDELNPMLAGAWDLAVSSLLNYLIRR